MPSAGAILFVTEKFPHPIDDGGQIRTWHVLAGLAAAFPVTLLSRQAPSAADAEAIRALGVEVVACGTRRPAWTVPWFAAEALVTRAPYPMRKNFSRALLLEIRRRLGAGGVRALHLNHLDAAQYVEHLAGERGRAPVVFDTHNLLARMYERFAATAANPLRKGYATIQWWRMSRFEPAILRAVDRVLVCSDLERERVHTLGVDQAMVVPNGVDVASFAPRARRTRAPGEPPTLLFAGGLGYPPNADGVRWFLDGVVPELRRVLPGFRFVVVGKGAPTALLARAVPGQVEFTGWVEDVRPHLAAADVCVCPLRVGGGTRIKILEAFAAGVPVVSTRVGAEGIEARHGESILIADDAAGFAGAIAELALSSGRSRAIADAASAIVAERYDWSRVLAPLVDWYEALSRS